MEVIVGTYNSPSLYKIKNTGGNYMIHLNNLEAEIYKLERELETAIMNDRSWEAECLRSDIKDLEIQLEIQLDNPQE
jgi:hypothetical protein